MKYIIQKKKTISAIFIFICITVTATYFSRFGFDLHHDGLMYKSALDISNGKKLFRESFTQYGALTALIQGLSLNLFGKYLITIKLVTAIFYGLIATMLFLIWSTFLNSSLTIFLVVIWQLLAPYYEYTFLPWSSVYSLFFFC